MANIPISAFTVPANTVGIGLSGFSLSGSNALSVIDLAGTWNTSGTPTAIKLNITDTASASNSKFLDLQNSGVSKFSVSKDGNVTANGFASTSSEFTINSTNTVTTGAVSVGNLAIKTGNLSFGFSTDPVDTIFVRESAGILAQRNGANAQSFRLYNTFIDASNYERGKFEWSSNVLRIGTEKAGTGAARSLELQTNGTTRLTVESAGVIRTNTQPLYVDATYNTGIRSTDDGYLLRISNRYGSDALIIGQSVNSPYSFVTQGSGFTWGTYGSGIYQSTQKTSPVALAQLNAGNAGNVNLVGWLIGKFGGSYSAASGATRGTGWGVWCGYGVAPSDTNGNGGDAGIFEVWLNSGGPGKGTGIAGANGKFSIVNDNTDAEVFSVGLTGNITTSGSFSLNGSTSGVITIQPQATAGTYTLTLPNSAGSANQVLTTDGSGNLSWSTAGGSPGGDSGQLQYNNSGSFAGMSGTSWNDTNRTLSITGATLTADGPLLDLSQTWNNAAATFTGLKFNVVNTASNSSSKLIDIQSSGTTRFSITPEGSVTLGGFSMWYSGGYWGPAVTNLFNASGHPASPPHFTFSSAINLGWASTTTPSGSNIDLSLFRDAADTLAQRRGTNPQAFRLYNTFTDASNYERGKFEWSSNSLRIGTEKAGTGVARSLVLQTDGVTKAVLTPGTGELVRMDNGTTAFGTGATSGGTGNYFFVGDSNYVTLISNNTVGLVVEKSGTVYVGGFFRTSARNGRITGHYASGTNTQSGDLILQGGSSTGSATPGKLILCGFSALTSGTTNQSATNVLEITNAETVTLANGVNLAVNATTGTKFGTSTTQKLAFWNATPIEQPANIIAIDSIISNLGLRASGGISNFSTDLSAPKLLLNGSTSGTITLQPQATAGTYTLTLPATAGSANQVLTTDGSGNLSWSTPSGGGGGSGSKTIRVFTPLDNQPPATAFATLDTLNSIASLDFDGAGSTNESAVFVDIMKQGADLSAGIKVIIKWRTTATTGVTRWGARFERCNTAQDADSWDTAFEVTSGDTNATANTPNTTEITCTSVDGIVAGDLYRVQIYRDVSDTADTITADAEVVAVELQQVA